MAARASAFSNASQSNSAYSFTERLKDRSLVAFYGSQTGTAEDYAGRLVKEATQYGLRGFCADLMDYEMDELRRVPSDKLVVFTLATYGEGEPTDNARDFHEWLMSDDRLADASEAPGADPEIGKPLSALRYVTFGLGNKTYEKFNEMVRICDKRLQQLGAVRIGPRGEGDDDVNMEEDFLKWKEAIFPMICEHFGVDPLNVKHELVRTYGLKELDSQTASKAKIYRGEIGAVNAWNGKQKFVFVSLC
jgi:NADPH-ferrihemoprotein reductase